MKQVEHELALIQSLDFPGYFLALWDIVRFARERDVHVQAYRDDRLIVERDRPVRKRTGVRPRSSYRRP